MTPLSPSSLLSMPHRGMGVTVVPSTPSSPEAVAAGQVTSSYAEVKKIASKMPYRQLKGTPYRTSLLGFGASALGGMWEDIDEDEGIRSVHDAFNAGINLFDTAPHYGTDRSSEKLLGRALESIPVPVVTGGIPITDALKRSRFVLSTKVGRIGDHFDHSEAAITRSLDESLAHLRTDYVDLLIAHDIEFVDVNQIIKDTLPAMRRLQKAGRCRSIGVSGYPLRIFKRIMEACDASGSSSQPLVDFVLCYARYGLHDTSLDEIGPELAKRGIGLIHASPLATGLLTENNYPKWHATQGRPEFDALREATKQVAEMCRAAGIRIEQLGVAHSLTNPHACSTLVAMKDRAQLLENLSSLQRRTHLLPDDAPYNDHHELVADPVAQLGTPPTGERLSRPPLSPIDAEQKRIIRECLAKAHAIYRRVPTRTWTTGRPENN